MRPYPRPINELQRQRKLRAVVARDFNENPLLNEVVATVRKLMDCPTCIISLVDQDEQWFKARDGFSLERTPRDYSLCSHTIMKDEVLVIPDALSDPRYCNHPVVVNDPHIRFYIGAPITVGGFRVGSLCAIDYEPRPAPSGEKLDILQSLARLVSETIESNAAAEGPGDEGHSSIAGDARRELLALVSHELKTPLTVILGNASVLEHFVEDPAKRKMVAAIIRSGNHLNHLITQMIQFTDIDAGEILLNEGPWSLSEITRDAMSSIEPIASPRGKTVAFSTDQRPDTLSVDKEQMHIAVSCILMNTLISGGDSISVHLRSDAESVSILVSDNGAQLSSGDIRDALSPFGFVGDLDTRATADLGLNLPMARTIAELHGGDLDVSSQEGQNVYALRLPSWRMVGPDQAPQRTARTGKG